MKVKGHLEFKFDLRASHVAVCTIDSMATWTANWNEKLVYLDSESVVFLRGAGVAYLNWFKNQKYQGIKEVGELFKFDDKKKDLFNPPLHTVAIQYNFLDESKKPIQDDIGWKRPSILDDYYKLLQDDKFVDIVLQCRGGNLNAHRSILSVRCEFFGNMLRSVNLESSTKVVQ